MSSPREEFIKYILLNYSGVYGERGKGACCNYWAFNFNKCQGAKTQFNKEICDVTLIFAGPHI